ncbi:hypothetical protein KC19_2G038900 [Ceratodon purpureus]|uniref:Uncharacterized protein n=1 Tax=Ceratodon purpureus TaxID=3225 RepID=A0A8T0ISN6_CERPU|nr:hypothetical protein KC19_2G038900 [Ceratodon purpureus]
MVPEGSRTREREGRGAGRGGSRREPRRECGRARARERVPTSAGRRSMLQIRQATGGCTSPSRLRWITPNKLSAYPVQRGIRLAGAARHSLPPALDSTIRCRCG